MDLRRGGVTLVEMLVVFGIAGIVLTLTLVSVQSARESARRVSCQNNLHQLGVAVANFTQSTHRFPSLLGNRGSKGDAAFDQTPFVAILPEMEIRTHKVDPYLANDSPQSRPPSILRCPSSNEYLGYRFCFGSGLRTLDSWDGVLRVYRGLGVAEITDGLSNSALMSERMSGKEHRKPVGMASLPAYFTDQGFANDCEQLASPVDFVEHVGLDWQKHQPRDVSYSHYAVPNSSHWDCQGGFRHLLISARSYHSGGVLTLNADGAVHWRSSNIDAVAWRALGTVAGHELSESSP